MRNYLDIGLKLNKHTSVLFFDIFVSAYNFLSGYFFVSSFYAEFTFLCLEDKKIQTQNTLQKI